VTEGENPVEPAVGQVVEGAGSKARGKRKPAAKKKASSPKGFLLIVESPAKMKTIGKFLGHKFTVKASMGHIRDLPQHRIGVDPLNNFTPHYVTVRGKGDILKDLRFHARKSKMVYIATDPDREGEAIGWHLIEGLKLKPEMVRRVVFNEITKKVVLDAVENSTPTINKQLVDSQQARRILDRIVGYSLSPLLWTKVRKGLSAGRVQSVVVRIVCEREAEINAFIPQEYWTIETKVSKDGGRAFPAKLTQVDGAKPQISNAQQAQDILAKIKEAPFRISSVEKKEQRRFPTPPFITSTLQQEAAKRHHFSAKRTMMIAQTLYEGVDLGSGDREGLITYMRTDSVRVSTEAQLEARKVLASIYGDPILPAESPMYKSKGRTQEGHEAIRPSMLGRDPESLQSLLNPDQYKLYKLIYQRFMASQSAPAVLDQTTVDITVGPATFRSNGMAVKFPGFMSIYKDAPDEDPEPAADGAEAAAEEDKEGILPAGLAEGDVLVPTEINPIQHFTNPPPRFTDASLVKALEEDGIGRPSTYAPTISTIQDRGYVERREGRFYPAELGTLVNGLLVQHFGDVINVAFTAKMEGDLDLIEEGKTTFVDTLREFYDPFMADMEKAKLDMRNVKKEVEVVTDLVCEKCGKPMMIRWGRHGKFLACTGYPDCKNAKSYESDSEGKITATEPEVTDEKCPKCEKPMLIKTGRFGRFMACSNYPECKTTRPIPLDFKCPRDGCGGDLVTRRSRRGRVFYGCNKYPDCTYVSWDPPVKEACPKCGSPFMSERKLKKLRRLTCPVDSCGHVIEELTEAGIAAAAAAASVKASVVATDDSTELSATPGDGETQPD
jgi:DNA topoisomerase-1